jgi:long-chain fatty acid transport protein
VAIVSTQAWSAGFQLNEFSSSGLGRAYSGEGAIADDAGNASRNPALIMMFDRPTFSAGAIFVDPDVDISGTSPTGASLIRKILRQQHGFQTCISSRQLMISLAGARPLPLTTV